MHLPHSIEELMTLHNTLDILLSDTDLSVFMDKVINEVYI